MHCQSFTTLADQAERLAVAPIRGGVGRQRERAWPVHTPWSVRRFTGTRHDGAPAGAWKRLWLGTVSLATVAALVSGGGSADAVPQPTVAQVQHRLAQLNAKVGRFGQQYDKVLAQLAQSSQRLTFLYKQTARYRARFGAMRQQVGRLATAAFEEGGATSPVALLTSSSPQKVLDESAILSELSSADASQISQYLAASRQLVWAQQVTKRETAQIQQLKRSLHKRLAALKSLQATEQALLAQLTPAQQAGVGPGGGSGGTYKGTTKTQAGKATWFVYQQLGCPYYFGGTGPCRSPGFDCSGLMYAAWGYAGVTIPRVSWDQMSSLPGVPLHTKSGAFTTAYLRIGDILGFAGNSHVGMWVGGGYVIDAPVPGQNVEKVALSGWYLSNLDGAVRP
jgi:cell wall-associated NlpC family hydrolase